MIKTLHIIRAFITTFSLIALVWLVYSSLRTEADLLSTPFGLQGEFTLINFERLFELPEVRKSINNSILISGSAALLTFLIAFPGAVALSRITTKHLRTITLLVGSLYILYPGSLALPFFRVIASLGLLDSVAGIALTHVGMLFPLVTLLLQSALRNVPANIAELAESMGMNVPQQLRWIILPVAGQALAAILLIAFAISWREYLFSFLISLTDSSRNLVVYQVTLASSDLPDWGLLFAMNLLLLSPALLVVMVVSMRTLTSLNARN